MASTNSSPVALGPRVIPQAEILEPGLVPHLCPPMGPNFGPWLSAAECAGNKLPLPPQDVPELAKQEVRMPKEVAGGKVPERSRFTVELGAGSAGLSAALRE